MAGTISDKLQGLIDSKADIAAAIEERGGTVPQKLSEYGNAIRELPAKYKEPADIEFIDYDGTILYEYTFAEIQGLTELPALPTHENLVNEGWNYTLDELKNPIDYIDVAYTLSGISGAPTVTVRRYAKARLTDNSTSNGNNTDYCKILSVTGGFTFDSSGYIYDTNGNCWGELATYIPVLSADDHDLFGYITQFFLSSESELVTADIVSQTPHYDRTQKFTVGCTYHTADGYTRIHIHLDSSDKTFTLAFQQSESRKVFLDWGDGTTDTPGTAAYIARTHAYTFDGDGIDKTIILHPATEGDTGALKFTGQICGDKTDDLKKITAIEIGDIGQISSAPFTQCTNLKALSIPSAAFLSGAVKQSVCQDFVGLECFVFPRIFNNGHYFAYDVQKLFFENCVSLKRVSLSNSVSKLGTSEIAGEGSVFSRCKSLQHICIPHNLTTIYNNAFLECLNLRKVYMHGRPYLGYTLFADCNYLDTCYVGMTFMDGAVFRDCCNLVSVTTEDGQSIQLNGTDNTFSGCIKLESVPPVCKCPKNAFTNCIKLEYLKCKEGTTFGQEAFKSSGLKTLDLSELSSNPIPTFGNKMLDNTRGDLKIIVPAGHLSDWQNATNWSNHASKMVEATT